MCMDFHAKLFPVDFVGPRKTPGECDCQRCCVSKTQPSASVNYAGREIKDTYYKGFCGVSHASCRREVCTESCTESVLGMGKDAACLSKY